LAWSLLQPEELGFGDACGQNDVQKIDSYTCVIEKNQKLSRPFFGAQLRRYLCWSL